jgi:prolyl 4-hydroxylase
MSLDDRGFPRALPSVEPLSTDGSIRRARGFLSAEECVHVGTSVADLLRPATVTDPRTGRNVPNPIRTSDAAVLPPTREDLVLRAINLRIAAISDTRVDQGEALTVLRYQPGQQFRLHSDTLPHTRNQRIRTVLIYLNVGYEGGETTFPDHGLTIAPKLGDAIIFDNTDARGMPDLTMRHAGQPVRRGVKWLATRWIRQRTFDPWTGPEADPVLR